MKAMLVKVSKDQNNKIKSAEFIFEDEADIPMEILQFVKPEAFRDEMKIKKVKLLEMILESTTEELEDAGYPDPNLLAKIEKIKSLIHYIKENDCICDSCKNDLNNSTHEDALSDILKANGISPN
jgi:hypothetical protein